MRLAFAPEEEPLTLPRQRTARDKSTSPQDATAARPSLTALLGPVARLPEIAGAVKNGPPAKQARFPRELRIHCARTWRIDSPSLPVGRGGQNHEVTNFKPGVGGAALLAQDRRCHLRRVGKYRAALFTKGSSRGSAWFPQAQAAR
jgi:hypothetical protein